MGNSLVDIYALWILGYKEEARGAYSLSKQRAEFHHFKSRVLSSASQFTCRFGAPAFQWQSLPSLVKSDREKFMKEFHARKNRPSNRPAEDRSAQPCRLRAVPPNPLPLTLFSLPLSVSFRFQLK